MSSTISLCTKPFWVLIGSNALTLFPLVSSIWSSYSFSKVSSSSSCFRFLPLDIGLKPRICLLQFGPPNSFLPWIFHFIQYTITPARYSSFQKIQVVFFDHLKHVFSVVAFFFRIIVFGHILHYFGRKFFQSSLWLLRSLFYYALLD